MGRSLEMKAKAVLVWNVKYFAVNIIFDALKDMHIWLHFIQDHYEPPDMHTKFTVSFWKYQYQISRNVSNSANSCIESDISIYIDCFHKFWVVFI